MSDRCFGALHGFLRQPSGTRGHNARHHEEATTRDAFGGEARFSARRDSLARRSCGSGRRRPKIRVGARMARRRGDAASHDPCRRCSEPRLERSPLRRLPVVVRPRSESSACRARVSRAPTRAPQAEADSLRGGRAGRVAEDQRSASAPGWQGGEATLHPQRCSEPKPTPQAGMPRGSTSGDPARTTSAGQSERKRSESRAPTRAPQPAAIHSRRSCGSGRRRPKIRVGARMARRRGDAASAAMQRADADAASRDAARIDVR